MPKLRIPGLLTVVALAATAVAQSGWTSLAPSNPPTARGFHALAYDLPRATTVMFGGWNIGPFADTWEWAGATWTRRTTANSPPARCCHALAHDLGRRRIVLFGGTDGTIVDRNDTWEYDGTDWTQRQPANRPGPRREVRMAYDLLRGSIILFGGGNGGMGMPVFGDTWEWNGTDWALLTPATSPPARWSHGMTLDYARARIVLFGGSSGGVVPFGDTWTWNGTDWAQVQTSTSPLASTRTALAYDVARDLVVQSGGEPNGGETWLFDGGSWRRDTRAAAPPPRATFSMAHDFIRGRTVLFGGYDSFGFAYLGDTWEYDPGVIATWSAFGGGCAGTAGTPTLRAAAGSLPILGSTFVLELLGVPGSGAAAISIGFSDQQWSGHTLPWDLGALGMPGCTLHASPDFLFFVPATAGRATLSWPLPNNAVLVGARFFDQGLVVDPGVNALGAVVSNAGAGVVGPF